MVVCSKTLFFFVLLYKNLPCDFPRSPDGWRLVILFKSVQVTMPTFPELTFASTSYILRYFNQKLPSTDTDTPETPEIVIPDKYGTHESTESGYTSSGSSGGVAAPEAHMFDARALADLINMRLLDKCQVSMYRYMRQA